MSHLKKIVAFFVSAFIGALLLLLRRKSSELAKAQVELEQAKNEVKDNRVKEEISELNDKIKTDDARTLEVDNPLSSDLDTHSDSGRN